MDRAGLLALEVHIPCQAREGRLVVPSLQLAVAAGAHPYQAEAACHLAFVHIGPDEDNHHSWAADHIHSSNIGHRDLGRNHRRRIGPGRIHLGTNRTAVAAAHCIAAGGLADTGLEGVASSGPEGALGKDVAPRSLLDKP